MDLLENQASDLRYLAQQPGAPSLSGSPSTSVVAAYETPGPSQQQQQLGRSPGSASIGDNSALLTGHGYEALGGGLKRKSIDDGPGESKQTRSKRNRYISIACNECKRRKIKCNGETPCQRCGNLNLSCLYAPNCCSSTFKDSDEYKQVTANIDRLQDEISRLNQAVKAIQTDTARPTPWSNDRLSSASTGPIPASPVPPSPSTHRPGLPRPKMGSFRGPTSMAFSLDVANNTIANMGYKVLADGDDQAMQFEDRAASGPTQPGDPLLEFDKDDIVRLCRLHEEEIGIMYPVTDIQSVIAHANQMAPYFENARQQRILGPINDLKTMELKMVMVCALMVEEHAHSHRAERIFDSMETVINRMMMSDSSDVANLPLLALYAGYRFLANDEILAWRVIGQVARLCLELGIHQRQGLMKIQDDEERRNALHSFWTAYILDRRWAFGTGLPYVVQDGEIDPDLPRPDDYPFLLAMISYSQIASKVWRQVYHFGPVLARELIQEEIERLDREILLWYDSIPPEVQMKSWDKETQIVSTPSYNLQRLRIWTYLRLNQIRIWLYTPVLHSATSIMSNPVQAQRVVDLAKDTIQYLSHLNNTTNLYRRCQIFYHQFLTSAISAVFLASVHAPVRFSAVCREEFYMALDLVKDLSAKSWVSKRLWRTIRSLKDVAPRFGLDPDNDPHSTAALGMIGLARGHIEQGSTRGSSLPRPSISNSTSVPPRNPETPFDQNGRQIQSEMSRIFEGYVGLNGFEVQPESGHIHHPRAELPSPQSGGGGGGYGHGDGSTVFPHLREMF